MDCKFSNNYSAEYGVTTPFNVSQTVDNHPNFQGFAANPTPFGYPYPSMEIANFSGNPSIGWAAPPSYNDAVLNTQNPVYPLYPNAPVTYDATFGIQPLQNTVFSEFVPPPAVTYDTPIQHSNPANPNSLTANSIAGIPTNIATAIPTNSQEKQKFQQGIFECWKTDKTVLFTTAVCPEATILKIGKVLAKSRKDGKVNCFYHLCTFFERPASFTLLILCLLHAFVLLSNGVINFLGYAVVINICWIRIGFLKIRRLFVIAFGLKEDFFEDTEVSSQRSSCIVSCCCPLCYLCQMYTEMDFQIRKYGPQSFSRHLAEVIVMIERKVAAKRKRGTVASV